MNKMLFFDRATFFFLCALIFVLPASVAGVSVFFVPALLCFLIRKGIEVCSPSPEARGMVSSLWPVFLPVGVFVLVNLLSILLSPYPELGVIAFRGKIMRAVFLFCMMVDTVRTEKRALIFLKVVLVSVVILCLDGLWQMWSGHDLFKHLTTLDGRISGSFKHPNDLGGYLALVLPAMVMFAVNTFRNKGLRYGWQLKIFAPVAALLGLMALGLTYSRGAWLGFFAGMVFLLFSFRRLAWPVLGAAVLFAIVFSPLLEQQRNVSFFSDHVTASRGLSSEGDTQGQNFVRLLWEKYRPKNFEGNGRLAFWRDGITIVRDHPVLGTGLNTYARVVRDYAEVWKIYPHNSYLHMAAETGLVGLGVFLWLIFAVFRNAGTWVRKLPDSSSQGLWSAVLAGLFGFLVHSFLDTTLFSVQLGAVFWIVVGLLSARWTLKT